LLAPLRDFSGEDGDARVSKRIKKTSGRVMLGLETKRTPSSAGKPSALKSRGPSPCVINPARDRRNIRRNLTRLKQEEEE
jgi:hypothetical protein